MWRMSRAHMMWRHLVVAVAVISGTWSTDSMTQSDTLSHSTIRVAMNGNYRPGSSRPWTSSQASGLPT